MGVHWAVVKGLGKRGKVQVTWMHVDLKKGRSGNYAQDPRNVDLALAD
jgi:hypothetical protein